MNRQKISLQECEYTVNIDPDKAAPRASAVNTSFAYTYGIGPRPKPQANIKSRMNIILATANGVRSSSGFFD